MWLSAGVQSLLLAVTQFLAETEQENSGRSDRDVSFETEIVSQSCPKPGGLIGWSYLQLNPRGFIGLWES